MNVIIGMADLLFETDLTTQQSDYLMMAHESATSLLALIDDLLDLAKVEAGKLQLEATPFDLRQHLDVTMKALRSRADLKSLRLVYRVADDVPGVVRGDAMRLRQVIVNLVGNGIKFTSVGEVSLRVSVSSRAERLVELQFDVSDTGIGIPADKQQAIFDAFVQVDSTATRRYGGTGLGLAIVSAIVKEMGGRIWVESETSQGSRFHFTARFTEAESAEAPRDALETELSEPSFGMLRILVVDDVLPNQILVQGKLQARGHCVEAAGSACEALDRLTSENFDLILMDVQMPDMDGFEATREIRDREQTRGRHTPIIAMTAHATQGCRERCLQSGMDGYVSKPIEWRQFAAEAGRVLGQASGRNDTKTTLARMLRDHYRDAAFAVRMLHAFMDAYPNLMARIREAIDSQSATALASSSHKLKGALGNLLGSHASPALLRLEAMAAVEDLRQARGECQALERFMNDLRDAIEDYLGELSKCGS